MSRAPALFDTPPRAFISYARSDGEAFAASLRERIECELPDIPVWQDRVRMEGGSGWWKQITEALDQVEFLIMVMTPAAMTSDVARKEWRYARQQGVRICPVMGVPSAELVFGSLPSWMRKAHFYDLEKEWDGLVAFLRSARKSNRRPFMAPDLRPDFVDRPLELDAMLRLVLDPARSDPIAGVTALQGAGGFGKTTLATALCHHEDVITAFDDGILWATLGQTPKLQDELTKLYAALTGERPAFIDADDAAIQLAGRLDEKSCLIVIDDVWDPNHAKPFLRGGKQCGRLITTRMQQVVTEIAASRVPINEMSESQSVQLLAGRLGRAPEDLRPMRTLARRLGKWPLLLKFAASQLRSRTERGASIDDAVVYVNRALDRKGVTGLDSTNPTARSDAVASTVSASLNLIVEKEATRCAELSVFPSNTPIPMSAIASLWGMDDFETEDLVQRLDGAALLDFDLKSATVRLHLVIQSYLHDQLDNPSAVHARLVHEGWPDPYALPDAYAWRWLCWHMLRAGDTERMQALLLDYDWLSAKFAMTDVQSMLEDFELLPEIEELRAVHDALRLASHGLTLDSSQLAAQLNARLAKSASQSIGLLLERAAALVPRPWLRLAHCSLTHPGGALIGILKGHAGSVEAVALTDDGSCIISASSDRTLRLWDAASGKVTRVLEGHAGAVLSVAVTADGRRAVSGSEDLTLRIWDLESGQTERVLRGHYGGVYGVAVSPDSRLAASVSDDGTVRIWDLANGEHRRVYKSSAHQLRSIAFSPCGQALIFSNGEWASLFLDLATGDVLRSFEGHAGNARAFAFTADGKHLLTGGDDAVLRLWEVATFDSRLVLEGHTGSVEAVAVSADGRRAISGSKDRTLRLWDLTTGKVLCVLEGHSGFVRGVALLKGGTQAVSASSDRTLRHWHLDGMASLRADGDPALISGLAISNDGTLAISVSRTGMVRVWDGTSGNWIKAVSHQSDKVLTTWFNGREPCAVTQSIDRVIRIWDLQRTTPIAELRGQPDRVERFVVSQDSNKAVTLGRDRALRAWEVAAGRARRALVFQDNERALSALRSRSALLSELELEPELDIAPLTVTREARIAIAPDGKRVVIASQIGVMVWNIDDGGLKSERAEELDAVVVSVEPQGRFALIGSRFGALHVFDLALGRTVSILEGHTERVLDVVIDREGQRAVSAARDDTIRVWDLSTGRQRGLLTCKRGKVDEVSISPNSKFAFSVYGDTLVMSGMDDMAVLGSLSFDHLITTLAVARDGRNAAVGEESGHVHFVVVDD